MNRIEAVVSDFGGVLTTPLLAAFAGMQETHGIPLPALGRVMAGAQTDDGEVLLYALERGAIPESEFLRILGEGLRAELGHPVDMEGYGAGFFSHLHPNAEMFAYLRGLHERGMRMAILTNNVREWEPLWRPMLPIDELFEVVVDSAFVGMRKPDPEIYQLTLEKLGIPAERTVFIDDMETNVEGARNVGMQGVWFQTTEQTIAELDALLDSAGEAAPSGT